LTRLDNMLTITHTEAKERLKYWLPWLGEDELDQFIKSAGAIVIGGERYIIEQEKEK